MMIYSLHSVELYFESFFLLQIKDDRVVRRLFEEVIKIFILFIFIIHMSITVFSHISKCIVNKVHVYIFYIHKGCV